MMYATWWTITGKIPRGRRKKARIRHQKGNVLMARPSVQSGAWLFSASWTVVVGLERYGIEEPFCSLGLFRTIQFKGKRKINTIEPNII